MLNFIASSEESSLASLRLEKFLGVSVSNIIAVVAACVAFDRSGRRDMRGELEVGAPDAKDKIL